MSADPFAGLQPQVADAFQRVGKSALKAKRKRDRDARREQKERIARDIRAVKAMRAQGYDDIFQSERLNEYPVIDALEARYGHAVNRDRLEDAARVLACPLKKNPPNWQHGRLIYAMIRSYLDGNPEKQFWLDIGTAKGFSAVCMMWAACDHRDDTAPRVSISSHDIIDPFSTELRNSVDDGKSVFEFVTPFIPDGRACPIRFGKAPASLLSLRTDRINFAFIDGSHTYEGVKADIEFVTARQQPGDIILFDDMQVPGVAMAVNTQLKGYDVEIIRLLTNRIYAIAIRQ